MLRGIIWGLDELGTFEESALCGCFGEWADEFGWVEELGAFEELEGG